MTNALSVLMLSYLLLVLILIIGWYVLQVVAYWRIFTKAGEPGWKSLIPIYNTYIQYRISWNTTMFLVSVVCAVAGVILSNMDSPLAILGSVCSLVNVVISFMACSKLSRAFGHGLGFAFGLFFLNPIFLLILGLGESVYEGPQ
ncbi:MAG: DUF5684 domain-containing protein [Eubacteriales bacterium]|nr:DUF5684 domain-containing protein [Eubacteriales bacterium]